jgi:hypothetical protein
MAAAQSTNGIPIVHRIYRYSGHAQLLGGPAANLPAPPPSQDDILIPGQDDIKINTNLKDAGGTSQVVMPARRPESKKDKDPFKSLFVVDATATNKTDPELKKWGWLAEEADANRQVLESYRKPIPEDESWTNSLAGQSATNEIRRQKIGSLKGNAYEPVGAEHTQTASVERVVEDHVARKAEQHKQDEARQKMAQKDGLNMAGKGDLPSLMNSTNVTLGLARTRRDDERPDVTLEADFSQTRKALAEITGRYQLNLSMADLLRRPVASPPDAAAGKTISGRSAMVKDGVMGFGGDTHYATMAGDGMAGMAAPARAAAPPSSTMPGSGSAWMKAPSGPMPMVNSASAMVEGPKAPKAYEMTTSSAFAPPPQPSLPAAYALPPSYVPGSSTPGYSPGVRPAGSLTPSFTPTAPYRNMFDTTPSR